MHLSLVFIVHQDSSEVQEFIVLSTQSYWKIENSSLAALWAKKIFTDF